MENKHANQAWPLRPFSTYADCQETRKREGDSRDEK
jgi:hypothetical protein